MSERLLRWVLRLYPKTWRDRYGVEMHEVAQEQLDHGETTRIRLALEFGRSGAAARFNSVGRRTRVISGVLGAAGLAAGLTLSGALGDGGGIAAAGHRASWVAASRELGAASPLIMQLSYEVDGEDTVLNVPAKDFFVVGFSTPVSERASQGTGPVPIIGSAGPVPVFAGNDSRVVIGHLYPGVGFVPFGRRPISVACFVPSSGGARPGERVFDAVTKTVTCTSTQEVVPDVVGVRTSTALTVLSAIGLHVQVDHVASRSVPAGRIVSQSPTPIAVVPGSTTIVVRASTGRTEH